MYWEREREKTKNVRDSKKGIHTVLPPFPLNGLPFDKVVLVTSTIF
jgi:hypothetical protein